MNIHFYLAAAIIYTTAAHPTTAEDIAQQSPESKTDSWKLLWSDEFDGDALNTKVWSRCHRGTSDWDNTMSPDPRLQEIKDGVLRLWGVRNKETEVDSSPYLTAGINSKGKFSFRYGKVQIRAKFKSASGAWPALWMMGETGAWPANGEIDLMEHLNSDDLIYQTLHSKFTLEKKVPNAPQKGTAAAIDQTAWNTYGCEWDADKIIFTVNGQPTLTYPRMAELGAEQWPFEQPFYLILSMQIGGEWVNAAEATNPEDFPASLDIDWVRVYQRKDNSESAESKSEDQGQEQ